MKCIRGFLLFLSLVFIIDANAQQANIWYLVDSTGLDFNSGTASLLQYGFHQTAPYIAASTASIADNRGQLLFYSDGSTIWDRNNNPMPNGYGINGAGGWQTLIVQKPASQQYYIFYSPSATLLDTAVSIEYSIVDMSLHNGLGDVTTSKNVLLLGNVSAKIGTITHANGIDTWLIMHSMTGSTFFSFLISASGISTVPVQNNIGNPLTAINFFGEIKPSPDGTIIAMSTPNLLPPSPDPPSDNPSSIELFKFDNATAQMSNPIFIQIPCHYLVSQEALGAALGILSVEYSPNGKLLYANQCLTDTAFIFQLNLCNYNQTAVAASLEKVGRRDWAATFNSNFYQMQLAPDNKIYIARNDSILSVINHPNIQGTGCGFVSSGINLGSNAQLGSSPSTLPYFSNTILKNINKSRIFASGFCLNSPTSFNIDEAVDSIKWDFGDISSGANNTSSSLNPSHTYPSPDTFIVKAILYTTCYIDTLTKSIIIYSTTPNLLGNDTTLCSGETLNLFANVAGQNNSFSWQDGSTNQFISVTKPGNYWVHIKNSSCTMSDTISVSYLSFGKIFLNKDTTLCIGNNLVLNAGNTGSTYLWNDGSNQETLTVSQSGKYWVKDSIKGCFISDTIQCNFVSGPLLNIGNDTSLCPGQQIILRGNSTGAINIWNDNSSADSLIANHPGKYWINSTEYGCTNSDTLVITQLPSPAVFLGNDTTLCIGQSILLSAPPTAGFQYLWQDNSTQQTLLVDTYGIYICKVTNQEGCSSSDTINIKYSISPVFYIVKDTVLCDGRPFGLTATPAIQGTYLWNTGSTKEFINIVDPGLYWIQITVNGCAKKDSTFITFKPSPSINFSSDTTLCDGQTLLLDATNANSSYTWQDGSINPTFTVNKEGLYSVKVDENGCDTVATIHVDYITKPIINLGSDTTLCITQKLLLNGSYPQSTFLWQDGSTQSSYEVTKEATYSVDVTNLCGVTIDSIIVKYENCACKFSVPNAFTPNNDGLNDIFLPKNQCLFSDYELKIFNRWGQLIFSSKNSSTGWDGNFKNQEQPAGTYVWMLSYKDNFTGKSIQKNGTVILIR